MMCELDHSGGDQTTGAAWLRRIRGGLVFGAVWSVLYKAAQAFPLRTPALRTEGAWWNLVPFAPGWTWLYLSMIVLVALAWLGVPAERLGRFRRHLYALAASGVIGYFVWPTTYVRPQPVDPPWLYRVLIAVDSEGNGFPCMHIAFAILAAAAVALRFCGRGRVIAGLALAAWVLAISWAILAVRQHTGADLAWGAGLGAVVAASFVIRR